MGHVFIIIMLAVMIPAYGIAIFREQNGKARNRKAFASADLKRIEMNGILQPKKEDVDWVEETFRRRNGETPEQWRDRLLYENEIAAEFQAIYGLHWKEYAVFTPNRYLLGPGWTLEGFHNSPVGDRLWVKWKEDDAVKAILYSKRGKIPPIASNYEPHMKIIPYSYAKWNYENGIRWYRRIEENLRNAGADVTMYFNDSNEDFDSSGGPYFVDNGMRTLRW